MKLNYNMDKKSRLKKVKKEQGFSIMEVMISMFVMTVGIFAAINLITSSMQESMNSRNRVVASGLAQEGVELVRNMRDNNWMTPSTAAFEGFPDVDKDNCVVDKDTMFICNNTPAEKILYYNTTTGFYVHATVGTTATKFRRRIQLQYDSALAADAIETVVESIVWWGGEATPPVGCTASNKCINVKSVLREWKNEG